MSFLSNYRANEFSGTGSENAAMNLPKDTYDAVITKVTDPEWSSKPSQYTGEHTLQFRVYYALPTEGNREVMDYINLPKERPDGTPGEFGEKSKGFQLATAILGRKPTPEDDLGQVIVPGARLRLFLEPKDNGYMRVCEKGYAPAERTRPSGPATQPARPAVPPRPARPVPADVPF